MSELFGSVDLPTQDVVIALLLWGVFPALVTRLAAACYAAPDRRRLKLMRSLYLRPLIEQPFWAVQQLERAVVQALFPHVLRRWRKR